MIALIISLLLSLGIISSPDDYHNASLDQQEILQGIADEDIHGFKLFEFGSIFNTTKLKYLF